MQIFKKAKQNRIFHDVVGQIQEAIIDGKLIEGTKLPSERSLQDIFGVSRGTLREALRVLEERGLLKINTGVKGGAFIVSLSIDQFSSSLELLIRYRKVSLRDLAEFREDIEGFVAALAAKRADKDDIASLEEILTQAEAYISNGLNEWDSFIDSDIRFHVALARISENLLYQSVLRGVYDNIGRFWAGFLPQEEWIMKEAYQDLRKLLNAIEKGDSAKACSLIQNHVRRFNRLMEECAGSQWLNR